MCFITHLNNNKFHIEVYLVISIELDLQPNKGLGVPSHPMFPYQFSYTENIFKNKKYCRINIKHN